MNHPYRHYRRKRMEEGVEYFFDRSSDFEKVTEVLVKLIGDERNKLTQSQNAQ